MHPIAYHRHLHVIAHIFDFNVWVVISYSNSYVFSASYCNIITRRESRV